MTGSWVRIPPDIVGSSVVEHVRTCLDDVLSAHGIKALMAMQRVLTPKNRVQFLVVPLGTGTPQAFLRSLLRNSVCGARTGGLAERKCAGLLTRGWVTGSPELAPTEVQSLHPPQRKVVRSGAQLVLKTRPGVRPRVRLLYLPRFRALMVAEKPGQILIRSKLSRMV